MFYLVRHGETDYSQRNKKIYQGFGVNLSPLTEAGIEKIKTVAKDERLKGTEIILSSPYTRAVQTAAILSKELGADIVVETNLHEWLANKNYIYESDSKAEKSYSEYKQFSGVYPEGEEKDWEDVSRMKARMSSVLQRYTQYEKVIVVCHGMLIEAFCGCKHPETGGTYALQNYLERF